MRFYQLCHMIYLYNDRRDVKFDILECLREEERERETNREGFY